MTSPPSMMTSPPSPSDSGGGGQRKELALQGEKIWGLWIIILRTLAWTLGHCLLCEHLRTSPEGSLSGAGYARHHREAGWNSVRTAEFRQHEDSGGGRVETGNGSG